MQNWEDDGSFIFPEDRSSVISMGEQREEF
jgi:hypothetical protein